MKIILRSQAKALAFKRYFTGTPCKHGHLAERLVSNGTCLECFNIKQKAKYHADPEANLRLQKIRRDTDPNFAAKKFARRCKLDPMLPARKAERQFDLGARSLAMDAGLSKYTSMRACPSGHVGLRFSADGKCVECNRIACLARHSAKPLRPGMEPKFRRSILEIRAAATAREAARREATKWWSDLKASRQTAIANGDKTYVGRPCPYGHDGTRYTSRGECVACAAAYACSKEKKEYDAIYGKKNRERIKIQHREYYDRTAPERLASVRKWNAANPEKRRTIANNYKARRRVQEGVGDSTPEIHKWKMAAPKVCYWCGIKCPKKYHIDHYEPLSKGGKHVVANLVIACPKCNLKKSAKDPYEFAATVGRLF